MMHNENAIEVKDVTKSFKVYYDKGSQLKERMLFRNRSRYEKREVLKGISFEVKKGEAIGLIGHNGCGKSTTLKLLTRIIYPDSGSIEMRGRVSSLIELGAGFHPDMSGRENIYTNAAIFGLNRKEIDRRIGDIIAFSELEEFIDNPVRTYSSGMYMRLAFSVAINVDADILLIDEILAVGDVSFQAKCFNKLREIKAEGTTIVIVSHALSQIEQICDRSIWIDGGRIREDGVPRIVDPHYMEYMSEKSEHSKVANVSEETTLDEQKKTDINRWGSGEVVMNAVDIYNAANEATDTFASHESCRILIEYSAKEKLEDVVIGVAIYRSDQTYIYGTNSLIDTSEPVTLSGDGRITLNITDLSLNEGTYKIDLAFHKPDGFNYDFWRDARAIIVTNPYKEGGIISLSHAWSIR
jgi:ABC-2 type transport system ATP-binding protein